MRGKKAMVKAGGEEVVEGEEVKGREKERDGE